MNLGGLPAAEVTDTVRRYFMIMPTREELDARSGLTLVEFGSVNCPHCQRIQPFLAEWLSAYPEVTHIAIEDGKGQRLGRTFRVKLWPSLILLRDGEILGEVVRPTHTDELSALNAPAST